MKKHTTFWSQTLKHTTLEHPGASGNSNSTPLGGRILHHDAERRCHHSTSHETRDARRWQHHAVWAQTNKFCRALAGVGGPVTNTNVRDIEVFRLHLQTAQFAISRPRGAHQCYTCAVARHGSNVTIRTESRAHCRWAPSALVLSPFTLASWAGDILPGMMCHCFLEFGKHGEHFLLRSRRALQVWKRRTPPRSRYPHVCCIWSLRRKVTRYFTGRSPSTILRRGIQLPSPNASLSKVPATEVQNIHSQRHVGIELSLVRELALDSSSPRPRKPHGTCIQLQLSQLLGGVEYKDRGNEVAIFSPALSAVNGTTQRTFHRRRPCYSDTTGDNKSRSMEVRSQRASIRTTDTASQTLPPAASTLPSLRPYKRKRVAQSDFWPLSIAGPQLLLVR